MNILIHNSLRISYLNSRRAEFHITTIILQHSVAIPPRFPHISLHFSSQLPLKIVSLHHLLCYNFKSVGFYT